MKKSFVLVPFVLHSNIGDKERVAIRKEDLDKLSDEDWAELKICNVHVCIIGIEKFYRKIIHPTIDEIEAQIKENSENMPSGVEGKDVLPFL